MKPRLLVVILLVAALFSGVVLWRVDRFVYGDRMAWAEAQARSQVSSLSQAIASEVQSARRMLATVNADTFKPDRTNWRAFQPYYTLALMTTQNGTLGITQMTTKPDSVAAGWTTTQLGQFIGPLGKEIDSRSSVVLRAFKDNKKNPHVAVIFAGGGLAYILVGSGGSFQSLIESQRGSLSSFSIVASDGLTISHAVPEYIGTVMGDSTLLKEIRSNGAAQGLGTYIQGQKQVFGFYEQVPGVNAYVISTVPVEELVKGRLSLAWQFVFLAIGFVLIAAAGYFWYEKKRPIAVAAPAPASSAQEVLPPIPSVSMENVVTPPPQRKNLDADVITTNSVLSAPVAPKAAPPRVGGGSKADSVPAPATPPDWQQEKNEAYRQVAVAMGQEMRAPLASILGFSQMVLSKTQDPDVVQAVESILREARSSRDVLDKLVTYSGERKSQKSPAKIEGPLVMALKTLDARLQDKGVRVEKDFKETSPWPIATEDLAKAFENFLENSVEAMERMQEKVIHLGTWEDAQGLHVMIKDSGEGIDRENLGKVFEPFFTTRSYANHVGLGLPVSAGILKEHQAKVKIQSQRGQGTQVDIVFPPESLSATQTAAAPPTMSAPELPAELPKVGKASSEEVAEALQGTEVPPEKLTDVNVDSLLEMSPEEAPLQFLDGMGFESEKPPPPKPVAIPPPVMAQPPPKAPPPAVTPNEQVVVVIDPEVSEESSEARTVIANIPERTFVEEAPTESATVVATIPEPIEAPAPKVVIDKPNLAPAAKSSALDSYKVEVKRPGKRT